jgi:hypothetical protein
MLGALEHKIPTQMGKAKKGLAPWVDPRGGMN